MLLKFHFNTKLLLTLFTLWFLLGIPGTPVTDGIAGTVNIAQANVLTEGIIPDECRAKPEKADDCGFVSFLIMFANLSELMLGIIGSLALLFFVYGGFVFLTAAGSAEKISQGKRTLVAAVIGIAIVLGSYTVIDYLVKPYLKNWQNPGQGVIEPSTTPSP